MNQREILQLNTNPFLLYQKVHGNFHHCSPANILNIQLNNNFVSRITLLFFGVFIFGQTEKEPFADEKSEKVFYIQLASKSPRIDGSLDDPVWSMTHPITDFVQEDPDNMAGPTEKMEVFLTYNDRTLFVAARLYDSVPDEIARQLAPRDDWYGAFDDQADWFSIDLDSRHDHQTAFSFAVNASGVISDEMVYNDADYDTDWNAVWNAEVQIDELGWVVEMEIPFSMLPFNDGDELTWGMNITRFIQRKYETITWVAFPLEVEGIASKYGHLTGLKGIYPPAKFEFSLYSLGGLTNYSDLKLTDVDNPISHKQGYTNEPDFNVGLDMKYRINTNSLLTLAVNPDYGQVESDPEDINLTSYETYLHEKREFFLKDSDIFETPIELFYSRRIGDNSWGLGMEKTNDRNDTLFYDIKIPVNINAAAKLTGKNEYGLSYGLLGAVTTESDSSTWHSYFDPDSIYLPYKYPKKYVISRVKQDLFSGNSFLGLMTTSSLDDSAHIVSIDGMVNLLDNQIGVDGQIVMSSDKKIGMLGNITYSPLGFFSTWIDFQNYEPGLDLNHLGYLWRNNYSQLKVGLKFQNQGLWGFIRSSAVIVEGDIEENSDGLNLGKTLELSYDAMFSNFWKIGGGFYRILDHYDDRKIFSYYSMDTFGPVIMIPKITGSHFHISSDKHLKLSGSLSWTYATNTRNDIERGHFIELTYRPNTFLSFSGSYDRYILDKQYFWLEELELANKSQFIFSDLEKHLNIITLRTSWNIGRDLSIQIYSELFQNNDLYSNYSEYKEDSLKYYIIDEKELYTDEYQIIQSENSQQVLNPNLYIDLFPQYTSFILNGVLKWNYVHDSNLYIVYTSRKSVNGMQFDTVSDFFNYNKEGRWVEVLRDQSIMLKIDYWFEL